MCLIKCFDCKKCYQPEDGGDAFICSEVNEIRRYGDTPCNKFKSRYTDDKEE